MFLIRWKLSHASIKMQTCSCGQRLTSEPGTQWQLHQELRHQQVPAPPHQLRWPCPACHQQSHLVQGPGASTDQGCAESPPAAGTVIVCCSSTDPAVLLFKVTAHARWNLSQTRCRQRVAQQQASG